MNPGDSISAVMQGTLPEGISGDYYVFVVTDVSNTIFEHLFENNNTGQGQAAMAVTLTPWCDLHVLEVSPAQDTAEAGLPLTISWTVKNSGPGTNLVFAWRDQVLVTASTAPFALAYPLKTIYISDTLTPDSSYTVTTQVILPYSLISQPYYLMVRTDIDNTIYEHGQDANNTAYSPAFFVKPYPPVDLQLTHMDAPVSANSGSNIPVSWNVQNVSVVGTIPTHWNDHLYLSSDTLLNPIADIEAGIITRYGSLEANAGYASTRNFNIPNGISGSYYLMMVADRNNVNQDADFQNNAGLVRDENGTPQPITITLTPPPDLVVTSLEASGTALTGQPFMLRYTVKNNGTGITNPAAWTDRFYLSSSMNFNPNTFSIGAKAHYGSLAPGESYTDSLSVTMPNWPGGNYILFMQTDATNLVYEHGLEDNNLKPSLVFLQQPPPADLLATQVIVPDTVMAGGLCTIYWSLQNQGTFPVAGNMTELVYFSTDDVWDIGDILFTSLEGSVNLGPQTQLGRSATAVLNDVSVGQWHVIIRTDVLNNIYESNESNNHGASEEKTVVTVPELPFDTWTPDILVNDIPLYYRIEIPAELAEESMLLRLKGDSILGINELYLKHGSVPTRSSFDYAFTSAASGNQDVVVPSLVPGTYYVLVYGKHPDRSEQDIMLFARILEFEILSIHANTGGNTGKITVQITGSKFTPGMSLFLHRNETKVFGYDLVYVNSSRVFVTFDLEGRDLGKYDVVGDKQCGGLALLKDGFRVVQGLFPSLDVNVYQPPNARPNGIVPIIIEYANSGTANLDLPNLILKSVAGAPVSFNLAGLEQGIHNLLIELRETGGPPNILRPGVSGSVTVFSKASSGLGFSIQIPKY
ncbi:MAG TPA: CARDB domain-containing protein [Bacteroidales bacterium]|nr:CARDB domain-containing protein [Bacteroidales bacterium]